MSGTNHNSDITYNIFYYAYKELSQDAVICWLIKCAYRNETRMSPLRECGQKFIEALFAKHDKNVPENLEKAEVWQQDNRIDVLARIGEYVLLIEDKKGAKDHSDQLNTYYKKVLTGKTSAGKVDDGYILPTYLKTGNQSLFDHTRIEHSTPYKVFDRRDFLKVVQPYSSACPILNDFTNYLKYEDDKTQSYKEWRENKEWEENWLAWQGFFRELENHLMVFSRDNDLIGFDDNHTDEYGPLENNWKSNWSKDNPWGWNYVPNPSGGFAGFWWYSNTVKSCGRDVSLYLQLEINLNNPDARKLCFKVFMDKPDHDIKWNCYERVIKAGGDLVHKPDRMGHGHAVTVALWDNKNGQNPWLVFKPNGGPDTQATVKKLTEAQRILDRVKDIT